MDEKRETGKGKRKAGAFPPCQFAFSRLRPLAGRWIPRLTLALIVLAVARVVNAQGCAMCYNDAAAASAGAIHALRSGIVVLITPPLGIFVTIFVVAYRNRYRFNGGGGQPLSEAEQLLRRSG